MPHTYLYEDGKDCRRQVENLGIEDPAENIRPEDVKYIQYRVQKAKSLSLSMDGILYSLEKPEVLSAHREWIRTEARKAHDEAISYKNPSQVLALIEGVENPSENIRPEDVQYIHYCVEEVLDLNYFNRNDKENKRKIVAREAHAKAISYKNPFQVLALIERVENPAENITEQHVKYVQYCLAKAAPRFSHYYYYSDSINERKIIAQKAHDKALSCKNPYQVLALIEGVENPDENITEQHVDYIKQRIAEVVAKVRDGRADTLCLNTIAQEAYDKALSCKNPYQFLALMEGLENAGKDTRPEDLKYIQYCIAVAKARSASIYDIRVVAEYAHYEAISYKNPIQVLALMEGVPSPAKSIRPEDLKYIQYRIAVSKVGSASIYEIERVARMAHDKAISYKNPAQVLALIEGVEHPAKNISFKHVEYIQCRVAEAKARSASIDEIKIVAQKAHDKVISYKNPYQVLVLIEGVEHPAKDISSKHVEYIQYRVAEAKAGSASIDEIKIVARMAHDEALSCKNVYQVSTLLEEVKNPAKNISSLSTGQSLAG